MLILGQTTDTVSVYDYGTGLVYRPSANDVIITIIPNPCSTTDPSTPAPAAYCRDIAPSSSTP
jgi:hypothetical protein